MNTRKFKKFPGKRLKACCLPLESYKHCEKGVCAKVSKALVKKVF